MEKMTGSLPEEDWREMKKIFRDFAFAGLESQISVCSSSTFSASRQVPKTKPTSGQGCREVADDGNASILVPSIGDCRKEVDENSEHIIRNFCTCAPSLTFGLTELADIFRLSSQPSQLSQPSQPNQSRPASREGESPGKAESQYQLPLLHWEAAEDSTDPQLEATAETCEERVFNSLNLTPEECLAAALQQRTPPWQGPENDPSDD